MKGLECVEKKLANERFVSNAPEEVVAKERERLDAHQNKVNEPSARPASSWDLRNL